MERSKMEELLALLADGNSWSAETLAARLQTTGEEIKRQMEFLEHAGYLRRVKSCESGCAGCKGGCGDSEGLTGLPRP